MTTATATYRGTNAARPTGQGSVHPAPPSQLTALARSIRAEWWRLTRPRPLAWSGLAAAVFGAAITAVLLLTLDATGPATGLTRLLVSRPGGMTSLVMLGLSFASIVLFAMFLAMAAGPYGSGTWRVELLHQPRRLTLAVGQFLARWGFTCMLLLIVLVAGAVTALAMAPGQGISTDSWLTADGLRESGWTALKAAGFAFGWGVLGTVMGTLTRSIPVGLGVGLVWFGPIENILGDNVDFATRWFPGLLLRDMISPVHTNPTSTIGLTLGAYLVVCVVVLSVLHARRDVTS